MLYEGSKLTVTVDGGIAVLCFDAKDESVNKFDEATMAELGEAGQALANASDINGLLVTSAKPAFIVGADIMEFGERFKKPEDELKAGMADSVSVFNTIEDLDFPSVTAINGMALGGGLEMCLSTDYRVMGAVRADRVSGDTAGHLPRVRRHRARAASDRRGQRDRMDRRR